MAAAENSSRKNKKPGVGTDRLANAARLSALEKNIGVSVKRHRDPGDVMSGNPFSKPDDKESNKEDTVTTVATGF
jgi:hypothetical protein